MPHLGLVTLVVPDYDEAIAFYVGAMGFRLVEDTRIDDGKRWVVVAPRGAQETAILLARAADPRQKACIGDQTGGRVALFLNTDDFAREHERMRAAGVRFTEALRDEPYGRVAVFEDRYGNRWDLIEPRRSSGLASISMADWATIASLATAGGTLILAVATFASVRSANRAARAAERSLLAGLRPPLMPSRLQDASEKVHFADGRWVVAPAGGGRAETSEDAIYLALSLRNVGSGIAVLHGWRYHPRRVPGTEQHPAPEEFRRLTRDLYVPAGDLGFWQGTFRDPVAEEFADARAAIDSRETVTLDLLYGDHEGGQRVISRFALLPRDDGGWIAAAFRHWNVDRADPR
ncbi:MAG: VOC family protein [Streptosporangiaceae bacterium]